MTLWIIFFCWLYATNIELPLKNFLCFDKLNGESADMSFPWSGGSSLSSRIIRPLLEVSRVSSFVGVVGLLVIVVVVSVSGSEAGVGGGIWVSGTCALTGDVGKGVRSSVVASISEFALCGGLERVLLKVTLFINLLCLATYPSIVGALITPSLSAS